MSSVGRRGGRLVRYVGGAECVVPNIFWPSAHCRFDRFIMKEELAENLNKYIKYKYLFCIKTLSLSNFGLFNIESFVSACKIGADCNVSSGRSRVEAQTRFSADFRRSPANTLRPRRTARRTPLPSRVQ